MKRLVILVAAVLGLASAYLKSFDVAPTRYGLSGTVWGGTGGGVAETFIANFDSAAEVDFFVGDIGELGLTYNVDIYEHPDGVNWVARKHNVAAPKGHVWLKFELETQTGQKFVRGKEYIVRVTRPGGNINWYKDTTDEYSYGHMVGGGDTTLTVKDDLCMKLFGKARVGDEFAVQSNVAWTTSVPGHETIPYDTPANWDACITRESAVGVKYDKIGYGFWGYVQRSGPSQFVWGWLDTLMTSYANHGVRPIMSFRGTPGWATCALESVYTDTGHNNWAWIGRPHRGAIPRGLYEEVRSGNSINPDNYYAKYIYEFVRRYGPKGTAFNGSQSGTFWVDHDGLLPNLPILLFEGFPEVPSGGLDRCWVPESAGGYWRLDEHKHYHPWTHVESLVDPVYRETLANHIQLHNGDTVDGRKSSLAKTYARLMIVVDSAVKMACTSPQVDTIRPKSVAYVGNDDDRYFTMVDWLDTLESYGADEFFDVASCWGYRDMGNIEDLAAGLQWVRNTFSYAGYAPRPCAFTEFGTVWPPWSQVARAYDLSKAYSVIEAANATPGYPALACAWFTFTRQYMPAPTKSYCWGIIDNAANDWALWEPAYAYQQWSALTNKADFEGRVPCGDSTFLLQFEDSLKQKFWIAWAADTGNQDVPVTIPARSDVVDSMSTQTDSTQNQGSQSCGAGGWLSVTLDTIPLIITERETLHRPDITVDSVWCTPVAGQGRPVVFHAKLRNHGSDSTYTSNPNPYLCTRVKFYIEGEVVRQTDYLPSIHVGDTVTVSADTPIQLPLPLPLLVRATANEEQMYVELGMDDNVSYFKCGTGP